MAAKVHAPDMLDYHRGRKPHPGFTPELKAYLIENQGVDPHILAEERGLTPRFIIICQRKLGLRTLTSPCMHRKKKSAKTEIPA